MRGTSVAFRSHEVSGRWVALAIVCAAVVTTTACGGNKALCAFRDSINSPDSRSQRRALLSTGIGEFCHQLLTHNAPLRMSADTPIIGRFYANACTQRELDSGDLFVQFSGFGYGFTNVSKKVTFTMNGAVQYNQDFLIPEDRCDIYAYFRPRAVQSSDFKVVKIQAQMAQILNALSPVGDTFGKQLVTGKLNEGFTVIHDAQNHDDVVPGIVELGKPPVHPFDVRGSDRIPYENLRTEIHQNQRDFVGPIEIGEDKRSIYITATVDGTPAVDVLLLRKEEGEAALRAYYDNPDVTAVAVNPILGEVVQAGMQYQRAVPVPRGQYYVVFDHSSLLGRTNPPGNAFDDRAALVSYVIQIGDSN